MADIIPEIKVGYLVSYDYELLKESLPTVYQQSDLITLAIDKNYKTWNGSDFTIENHFFEWIKEFDNKQKIKIYFDDFYVPDLSPIECETRERNMLAKFMGEGGWHIQVDTDEYFMDFNLLIQTLKKIQQYNSQKVNIFARLITIFKKIEGGYLLVNSNEYFPLATNNPDYTRARYCENTKRINTTVEVVHQSWARTDNEIKQKLANWGHVNDFNTDSFFKLWNALDIGNYMYIANFHPLLPTLWKNLVLINKTTISDLIEELKQNGVNELPKNNSNFLGKIYKSITPPIVQKLILAIRS